MGAIREALFGKVDLDTIVATYLLGARPGGMKLRWKSGSASSEELADEKTACIEVGGSGAVAKNNFDHHSPLADGGVNLSACAQVLERLAKLVRYVDELDRGDRSMDRVRAKKPFPDFAPPEAVVQKLPPISTFPSLAQLVSGMLLTVRDPEERMRQGLEIVDVVVQTGVDPYASMEPILDVLPQGRKWAEAKRVHDRKASELKPEWYITKSGKKLAVIETEWFGAPGELYGRGAEIVISLNPVYSENPATESYRKFTVAGKNVVVRPLLEEISKLEAGWAGPPTGTIFGSPRGVSSTLMLEKVREMAIETL